MLFSILIPTLESRLNLFSRLHEHLAGQIAANGLERDVEILWLRDGGEQAVGYKRNRLLEQAKGDFVAYVDDDDTVSDTYVPLICNSIRCHPDIDCIGIKGIVTFAGAHPHMFIHSLRYRDYSSRGGIYVRPPYHLNPIRRTIACRYRFEEINYSEDIDWAMRIARDQALRNECFIDSVLYYYHSRRSWAYQWLLDRSEPVRHRLGLRLSNRIQIRRRLRQA